jgi:hypothetical protein
LIHASFVSSACSLLCYGDSDLHMACVGWWKFEIQVFPPYFTYIFIRNDTNCLTIYVFLEGMLWLCTHHCNGDRLWTNSSSEFNPFNSYYLEFGQGGASLFQVWICLLFSSHMNGLLTVRYG